MSQFPDWGTTLLMRELLDRTQQYSECLGGVTTCGLYLLSRDVSCGPTKTGLTVWQVGPPPHTRHYQAAAAHRHHKVTVKCNLLPSHLHTVWADSTHKPLPLPASDWVRNRHPQPGLVSEQVPGYFTNCQPELHHQYPKSGNNLLKSWYLTVEHNWNFSSDKNV